MLRSDRGTMQQHIVASTMVAIRDHGIKALTIDHILHEAQISRQLYESFFPTQESLYFAVHTVMLHGFLENRAQVVLSHPDPRRALRLIASTAIPQCAEDPLAAAMYDLIPIIRRSAAHQAVVRTIYLQQVGVYSLVLEKGVTQGVFTMRAPIGDVASTAVMLEDSLGLHVISQNASISWDRSVHLLMTYLATATGCDELISWQLLDPDPT